MNKEQIRIKIAEACGWTPTPEGLYTKDPAGLRPPFRHPEHLPDYLNDLNAMHEAETVLTEKKVRSYAFILAQVLDTSPTVDLDDQFLNIHATAAQRAEAFLKTLGLWKP